MEQYINNTIQQEKVLDQHCIVPSAFVVLLYILYKRRHNFNSGMPGRQLQRLTNRMVDSSEESGLILNINQKLKW